MFLSLFDHNPACIARSTPPRSAYIDDPKPEDPRPLVGEKTAAPRQLPRADRRGVVAATDSWSSIGIPGDQSGPAFDSRKGFQRILRFGEDRRRPPVTTYAPTGPCVSPLVRQSQGCEPGTAVDHRSLACPIR